MLTLTLQVVLTLVAGVGMVVVAKKYYRHSIAHPEEFREGTDRGTHLRAAIMLVVMGWIAIGYAVWGLL